MQHERSGDSSRSTDYRDLRESETRRERERERERGKGGKWKVTWIRGAAAAKDAGRAQKVGGLLSSVRLANRDQNRFIESSSDGIQGA